MERSNLRRTFLCLEHFALAAWASVRVSVLSHDCLRVHPTLVLRLGLVPEALRIAMFAIDLAVGSVEEGGGVQHTVALEAAHAVLVERSGLRRDSLGLKDFARTSHTRIRIALLAFNFVFLSESVFPARSPEFPVAHLMDKLTTTQDCLVLTLQ